MERNFIQLKGKDLIEFIQRNKAEELDVYISDADTSWTLLVNKRTGLFIDKDGIGISSEYHNQKL